MFVVTHGNVWALLAALAVAMAIGLSMQIAFLARLCRTVERQNLQQLVKVEVENQLVERSAPP